MITHGLDLIRIWPANHRYSDRCPGCGADAAHTALVELAYAFAVCGCDAAPYTHLSQQLWHRSCLAAAPVDEHRS